MSPATVIFVHVGRTGGTTLARIAERQYRRRETFSFASRGTDDGLEPFRRLPAEQRKRFRLIKGHMPFGVHEFVPGPSTYITLFRHPVDRVISYYYYAVSRPSHRLHREITGRGITFEQFMAAEMTVEVDNWQTRSLSGRTSVPYGRCGRDMLDLARQNLDTYFSVVGLTDRFDETLVLLGQTLGWRRLLYATENALRARPSRIELPEHVLAVVAAQNAFDLALYSYAEQRFERAIASLPEFARDLARFRARNALYQPWARLHIATVEWKQRVWH